MIIIRKIVPIICVCFIVLDYYTLIKIEIPQSWAELKQGTICRWLYLIPFTIMIISFIRLVFGDPGYIPIGWTIDSDKLKSIKPPRYCSICKCHKVHRAHHCSKCQRCVLRMDHHCPYFDNCIGVRNHKFFILFLFNILLMSVQTMAYAVVWMLRVLPHVDTYSMTTMQHFKFYSTFANSIVSLVYSAFFLAITSNLLTLNFRNMWKNLTTVEDINPSSHLDKKALRSGIMKHLYDLGSPFKNLKSFLGENVFLWLLPIASNSWTRPQDWVDKYGEDDDRDSAAVVKIDDMEQDFEDDWASRPSTNTGIVNQMAGGATVPDTVSLLDAQGVPEEDWANDSLGAEEARTRLSSSAPTDRPAEETAWKSSSRSDTGSSES